MSTEIPEDGDASPIDPSMEKTPPFVQKLLQLLQDGRYTDFIDWTDDGKGIIIRQIEEFSEKVLPKFFKHSNFQSFIRQLNMYDFHTIDQEKGIWRIFRNPLFTRDSQQTERIRRKVPPSRQKGRHTHVQLRVPFPPSLPLPFGAPGFPGMGGMPPGMPAHQPFLLGGRVIQPVIPGLTPFAFNNLKLLTRAHDGGTPHGAHTPSSTSHSVAVPVYPGIEPFEQEHHERRNPPEADVPAFTSPSLSLEFLKPKATDDATELRSKLHTAHGLLNTLQNVEKELNERLGHLLAPPTSNGSAKPGSASKTKKSRSKRPAPDSTPSNKRTKVPEKPSPAAAAPAAPAAAAAAVAPPASSPRGAVFMPFTSTPYSFSGVHPVLIPANSAVATQAVTVLSPSKPTTRVPAKPRARPSKGGKGGKKETPKGASEPEEKNHRSRGVDSAFYQPSYSDLIPFSVDHEHGEGSMVGYRAAWPSVDVSVPAFVYTEGSTSDPSDEHGTSTNSDSYYFSQTYSMVPGRENSSGAAAGKKPATTTPQKSKTTGGKKGGKPGRASEPAESPESLPERPHTDDRRRTSSISLPVLGVAPSPYHGDTLYYLPTTEVVHPEHSMSFKWNSGFSLPGFSLASGASLPGLENIISRPYWTHEGSRVAFEEAQDSDGERQPDKVQEGSDGTGEEEEEEEDGKDNGEDSSSSASSSSSEEEDESENEA